MKIATYNVNGIGARLPLVLRWLEESSPDIVCFQELKAPQDRFPFETFLQAGYHSVWNGQKSWNGVAILSKGIPPVEVIRQLPGDAEDSHSRYIEAKVGDVRICCLYLPNGNPYPGPKFDYKLRWFERLIMHAAGLAGLSEPVVMTGDYNVMPTEIDVYKPERWLNDALFRIEVREAFRTLLSQGWTDAIRKLYPDQVIYTFWDYFRNSYQRNAGLRIDHFLLNAPMANKLVSAGVDHNVRGWERSSDHAPVWIEVEPGIPLQ